MPALSFQRYANMPEAERLRRIGELIATAVIRYDREQRAQRKSSANASPAESARLDPESLVTDEIEKQMLRYLARVGVATPKDFQVALSVSSMTVGRRLARLRAAGIIAASGRKRSVRYHFPGQTSAS